MVYNNGEVMKMANAMYLDPASTGYIMQIITGLIFLIIPVGLLIFFVVWTVIKIKKLNKKIEQLEEKVNSKNT